MKDDQSYVLLTDAAPLREGGSGCQVLGRDWLMAMGDRTRLIVTHRTLFGTDRAEIEQGQTLPVRYYYNLGALRLGRLPLLRRCLEWLVFLCVLPGLARAVRASGAKRIFALSGAAPGFLFMVSALARACGLPYDLFLVDDYEEFVRFHGQAYLAPAVRFFERRALARADRVFVISQGYADHLQAKYNQRAHWLPVLAVKDAPAIWRPYRAAALDERPIVFVGSIHFLYQQGLIDLHEAIGNWNRGSHPYRLRLQIVTRREPPELLKALGPNPALDLVLGASDAERDRLSGEAWAIFLPYSFTPEARHFVTTSFSYKFTDAIAAGRPIVVYGPSYGSLPRYFQEEALPLCATSKGELDTALEHIPACDNPATIARYAGLLERNHSPAALRRRLEQSPSTAG